MIKVYYQWKMKLLSPLAIGSGIGGKTDRDVLLASNGLPFIPASAIAGILRAQLDEKTANDVFGKIDRNGNNIQSKVYTFDAVLDKESVEPFCTVRDSVKLSQGKTSVKGAKFDMEAVEPGVEFVTYLEVDDEKGEDTSLQSVLKNMSVFTMGAKSTRGYGKIQTVSLKRKAFDLTEDVENWLNFDVFTDSFTNCDDIKQNSFSNAPLHIKATLQVNGSPFIRRYTTDLPNAENNNPDFIQLTLNDKKTPVIPGTSWSGAFRHHLSVLAKEIGLDNADTRINELFGFVEGKESKRSQIIFSESQITGEITPKIMTRTAIDRFTGGSSDKSLFTEKTFFGGETELEITVTDKNYDKELITLLFAVLADLHNGILAVGGQTSVGHGLFAIIKFEVNGKDVSETFFKYDFENCFCEEGVK